LQAAGHEVLPIEVADVASGLEITPEVLSRSMRRLEYTTGIDPAMVQDVIDYVAELGYIKSSFSAEEILDLRFLESGRAQ
jgi:NitT/TauT family transport system substrate-binding protein